MNLKKTGIVRRIDHLGRLVIPAELRKTYNINDGDALETFINDDGDIVIRKYQLEDELTESVKAVRNLIESYGDTLPYHVAVALKKHTFVCMSRFAASRMNTFPPVMPSKMLYTSQAKTKIA